MKLPRKWLLAIALVLSLTMAISGTLAYLTDRDTVENVFTMGNVDIEVEEDFPEGGSPIKPGETVNKDAKITNEGSNPAWVWMTVSVPEGLKDYVTMNWTKAYDGKATGPKVADGQAVWTVLVNEPLAAGAATADILDSVALSEMVDYQGGKYVVVQDGKVTDLQGIENGQMKVTVNGYATQVEGLTTVTAAYNAYNAQWGGEEPKNGDDDNVTYEAPADAYEVSSAEELTAAVAAGHTVIKLADGQYDVTGCGGKNLTLYGSKNVVLKLTNEGEDGCDYGFGSSGTGVAHYTFNGITIDTTANTGNYKGYAYMGATFNDCSFVGAYSLNNANDFTFNYCDFNFQNGYLWTWAANNATFNNCTFNENGNSKCILAHGSASTNITINNCKFAASEQGSTWDGNNTACVEIDPTGTNVYTINFTGTNTKTESYSGWTRVKDDSTGHTITGLE